jgi:hypothetical protein
MCRHARRKVRESHCFTRATSENFYKVCRSRTKTLQLRTGDGHESRGGLKPPLFVRATGVPRGLKPPRYERRSATNVEARASACALALGVGNWKLGVESRELAKLSSDGQPEMISAFLLQPHVPRVIVRQFHDQRAFVFGQR